MPADRPTQRRGRRRWAVWLASFGLSDLAPIRIFALWGSLGAVIVWLAVIALVPRGAKTAPRPPAGPGPRRRARSHRRLVARRWRWPIIGASTVVTAMAAGAVPRLRVDPQPLHTFPAGARIVRDTAPLERRLTGTLPFEVAVTGEADFMSVARATPFIRTAVDLSAFSARGIHTYLCLADSDALGRIEAASEGWRRWALAHDVDLELRGVAAQLLQVRRLMVPIAVLSIPCMIAVAGIAATVVSRSVLRGVLGAWVNLVPLAGLVLAAVTFDWPLELPALMVGAIAIGVGIDDSVHVLWASRRCRSVGEALRDCLRPCLASSLIAVVCLAAFTLSPFRPTVQFGLLMATALLFASTADLLLLPSLLAVLSPRIAPSPAADAS